MKTKLFLLAAFMFALTTESMMAQTTKVERPLPALSYDYAALEPFVDSTTMYIHYNKHYKGYYNKFLKASENTDWENMTMEQIFASISKADAFLRNNAGGYYNHKMFWTVMSPEKSEPSPALEKAIERDFGSLDSFKAEFSKAANGVFGSGWAWLILKDDGHLAIVATANQDNPLMEDAAVKGIPLLNLDVWEHAYYLEYQNKRADYVQAFWHIVNWNEVSKRYAKATKV